MISVTITDRSGRTLSGQTIDAFWISIAHARPFSVGINCALGAREMRPVPRRARRASPTATSAATRTPACRTRSASTTSSPTRPAAASREFAASGFVNIVGGCCGTTPDHIRAIADGVAGCRRASAGSSQLPTPQLSRSSSGLEPLDDPARVQLPDDRRAHQRHRLEEVRAADQGGRLRRRAAEVALEQVRGGANIIDVNMDEGMLDSEQAMTDVPELHRAPSPRSRACRSWSTARSGR